MTCFSFRSLNALWAARFCSLRFLSLLSSCSRNEIKVEERKRNIVKTESQAARQMDHAEKTS